VSDASSSAEAAALAVVQQRSSLYVEDLTAFVRIPSVSTDAKYEDDVLVAAEWVAARLKRAGFPEAEVMPTDGYPVVVGRWHAAPGAPTVIIYGHYDVQTTEPLELWESPPFQPELRDGKLYGRGASDDKAGVLTAIQAVEASASATGTPPINVTFMIEGEEEIGSPNLVAFLESQRELLAADLAISADGGIYDVGVPSLTVGSRGLTGVEVTVTGANADLHSGMYGGAVANPLMALSHILSSLQDQDGVVQVPGFYDGIPELTPQQRAAIAAVPAGRDELGQLALSDWWGDPAYAAAERRLVRPTLEVNGMWGGYQGAGIKTVLPSQAHAKITCRLVEGQEPDDVAAKLADAIKRAAPRGVTVEVKQLPGKARAYQMPLDLPILQVAGQALEETYGRAPFPVWTGGTVPVAEQFGSVMGIWCLYYAFGEPDNGLHAPNEFFRVASLTQGTKATVRLLFAMAQNPDAVRVMPGA
jgi:acetylornithine deacetylase/succinyl-diaminopimelate desuccinylase-like protein